MVRSGTTVQRCRQIVTWCAVFMCVFAAGLMDQRVALEWTQHNIRCYLGALSFEPKPSSSA